MIASGGAGLVGRQREYDRLTALLDAATAGRRGGAVSVSGEPGIGKTALVDAVVAHARRAGWAVLEGRGYDLDGRLDYGPIAAALSGYLHRLPGAARQGYCAGLGALGTVVEGLGGAPDAPRSKVFQSIALLLGRIAADAPVLLVVDDLHWADEASVDVLGYLVGDLDALGVVLMVALREGTARPDVRRLAAALARVPLHAEVSVGRLDRAGIVALAAELLGGPARPDLVELITRRSAGTPLAVQALVHDLRGRDVLHADAGGWRCVEADPDVPRHLLELYGTGLERLPPVARHVLEIVCVGGEPVPHARLASLAECGDPGEAIDALRIAGLLRSDGRARHTPAHPLIADAVLARLGPVARSAMHARYVAVLQAEGVTDPAVLARHHLGAGDLVPAARAREVLAAAGMASLRRGVPDAAVRWLTAAVAVPGPGSAALLLPLGLAWQQRGDTRKAVDVLRTATDELHAAGDREAATEAAATAARLAWLVDDVACARRYSAITREIAADGAPALRAHTAQQHAQNLVSLGDLVDAAATLRAADHDLAMVTDPGTRGRLIGHGAFVATTAGTGCAADALRLLGPAAQTCDDERLELVCSNSRMDLLVLLGRWSELDAELAASWRIGERGPGTLRMWRSPIADFHRRWATGDWDGAQDVVTELADAPHGPDRGVETSAMRMWIALHRGDITGWDGGLAARFGPARQRKEILRALVAARTGEPPHPLDDGCRGWLVMFEWWHRLARVETLAASGDRRGLLAEAADLRRLGGGTGSAPDALAGRAMALAAGRSAADHAAAAATAFETLRMPVDAATVRVEAAERVGTPLDGPARERLRADLALLDRLGARPLADRVRRLLGGPAAPRIGRPVLTPREREVAELVADGLPNAAIAERLVISVRTVTSHLDHVYTKLGISSRTALARELRTGAVT